MIHQHEILAFFNIKDFYIVDKKLIQMIKMACFCKTKHCLLTAAGARAFMESQGIAAVPKNELVTPMAQTELEEHIKSLPAHEAQAASR